MHLFYTQLKYRSIIECSEINYYVINIFKYFTKMLLESVPDLTFF